MKTVLYLVVMAMLGAAAGWATAGFVKDSEKNTVPEVSVTHLYTGKVHYVVIQSEAGMDVVNYTEDSTSQSDNERYGVGTDSFIVDTHSRALVPVYP